jgi:hypothetical protein
MRCYAIQSFKIFLSISYTNAIILPNFTNGIIGTIHNYVIHVFLNILPIIYINGITMSIFKQKY